MTCNQWLVRGASRSLLSVVLGCLLWGGAAAPAAAQDPAACSDGSGLAPVPGLVPFNTSQDAEATSGLLFGAVNTLERKLIPMLGDTSNRYPYALHLSQNSLFGAVKVPIRARRRCLGLSGADDQFGEGFGVAPVDLHALTFAASYRLSDHWQLLYASSLVTAQLAPTGGDRFIGAGLTFLAGSFATLTTPLIMAAGINEYDDGFTHSTFDYVAAIAYSRPRVGELRIGYVGSNGLYSNLSQRDLFLFARAVLSDGLKRFPLLEGGLERLPLLGATHNLFARRLEYVAPRPALVAEEDAEPESESLENRLNFTTINYSGLDLWKYFDVHLAMTLEPEVVLHHVRLTLHQEGFNADRREGYESAGGTLGAWMGVVQTPDVPYYGVESGLRFEAGVAASLKVDDFARAFVKLSLNDREMLTVFPYAANSVHFTFGFEGLDRD